MRTALEKYFHFCEINIFVENKFHIQLPSLKFVPKFNSADSDSRADISTDKTKLLSEPKTKNSNKFIQLKTPLSIFS